MKNIKTTVAGENVESVVEKLRSFAGFYYIAENGTIEENGNSLKITQDYIEKNYNGFFLEFLNKVCKDLGLKSYIRQILISYTMPQKNIYTSDKAYFYSIARSKIKDNLELINYIKENPNNKFELRLSSDGQSVSRGKSNDDFFEKWINFLNEADDEIITKIAFSCTLKDNSLAIFNLKNYMNYYTQNYALSSGKKIDFRENVFYALYSFIKNKTISNSILTADIFKRKLFLDDVSFDKAKEIILYNLIEQGRNYSLHNFKNFFILDRYKKNIKKTEIKLDDKTVYDVIYSLNLFFDTIKINGFKFFKADEKNKYFIYLDDYVYEFSDDLENFKNKNYADFRFILKYATKQRHTKNLIN